MAWIPNNYKSKSASKDKDGEFKGYKKGNKDSSVSKKYKHLKTIPSIKAFKGWKVK